MSTSQQSGASSLEKRENGVPRQRRKVDHDGDAKTIQSPENRRKRKPSRSFWRRATKFALKHRWPIPLLPLLAFALLYTIIPNVVRRFAYLSYEERNTTGTVHYGKGAWDIGFVLFYTLVLSFTREFIMQELLRPLSRRCGIASRAKQLRFMEQMYTVIYFGIMGPAGLYVMRHTPEIWYFNTRGMYESFPHRTHAAGFKFYYLFQAAYWAQQAIVMLLGLEKPRKDFKELVVHHIVTLALIGLSYRFHFTYMGIAVYITHDVSDFFLAVGKSLQYANSDLAPLAFAICAVIWIYLRHYLNLCILFSLLPGGQFQTVGSYELNWETQQYKCWISNIITFFLLACLQALNVFWLYCLLRSFYRFLVYRIVKDDRSEDEGDEKEPEKVE